MTFATNEVVIKQGDMGDSFYVIRAGSCTCSEKKTLGKKAHPDMHENDFFGEMGLLGNQARQFTVTAKEPTKCVCISKADFEAKVRCELGGRLSRRVGFDDDI